MRGGSKRCTVGTGTKQMNPSHLEYPVNWMLVFDLDSRTKVENQTALAVKGEGRREPEMELYGYLHQIWLPLKHESKLV